jgi:hypothetical protein
MHYHVGSSPAAGAPMHYRVGSSPAAGAPMHYHVGSSPAVGAPMHYHVGSSPAAGAPMHYHVGSSPAAARGRSCPQSENSNSGVFILVCVIRKKCAGRNTVPFILIIFIAPLFWDFFRPSPS